MSNTIGYGHTAIKQGDDRYHQAIVNLMKATQNKPDEKPSTVVESKPADSAGKHVDVKA
jgi:hypothetical protein